MRRAIGFALALIALATLAVRAEEPAAAFDALLARYVSTTAADGIARFDYARLSASAADREALAQYIAAAAAEQPSRWEAPRRLAYWANLYNAITLKVVVDHYPVASIRDIKSGGAWLDPKAYTGPWVEKRVRVEGRDLSLDDIEHKILRPEFNDPRVHYAVNCASLGCPNLSPRVWRAATLEADLDAAARAYVNHPRGVSIEKNGRLVVSSIYAWFKADFGGTDAGVIAHLRKFAAPELEKRLAGLKSIAADRYDWSINDASAKVGAK